MFIVNPEFGMKVVTDVTNFEVADSDLHGLKSLAGKLFALVPFVKSVAVFNRTGEEIGLVRLYLKKDESGKCVMREER